MVTTITINVHELLLQMFFFFLQLYLGAYGNICYSDVIVHHSTNLKTN